jgi:hypothetical protein
MALHEYECGTAFSAVIARTADESGAAWPQRVGAARRAPRGLRHPATERWGG